MATPFELEQQRQQELASAKKQSLLTDQKTVDNTIIQNATPDSLKPKGLSKLPLLIFGLGSQIPQIIEPSLQGLINKYIPDPNTCTSKEQILELISQRNNIVQSLNNIGTRVDKLGTSVTGVSNFLNILLGLLTTIEVAAFIASAAAKAIPIIPGAVPAALNDIQTFIRKTTFDQQGNSKLSRTQSVLNTSSLVISMISVYVLRVTNILKQIDLYISNCSPELSNELTLTSPQINQIAEIQNKSQNTLNETSYQGFIIDIEEVPFSPTVTRRKAVGRNTQGITLIQTELSFTTDTQTLVNELKFIIDRDNLKAY
jgi:hypothetical protein